MPSFTLERVVAASPEQVFDLSLDVGLHLASQRSHGERVASGRTSGLLGDGEHITWSARHFGVRFRMASVVFDVDRPRRFRDRQVRGPFGSFLHTHEFEPVDGGTLMRDTIRFRSPLGPLGRLVDAAVMRRHLMRVITERNDAISAHFG
ncbi:SRPBCC family protein [Microbacterium esteraromaticum]|uniref:SRPBCC family protein n=1 Tax=Microbacterium esteraromaticum TaxID=57043 RepID=UPI0019561B60|nr:SRPBCC family protein [Microbacterium esteraromaticum]MBM7465669.1 ligand-binding SRPBCC domain-containing protein [Microbacterium esteraromaticum]